MIHAQIQRLISVIKFGTLCGLVVLSVSAYAFNLPAKPTGHVSDLGEILTEESQQEIETKLSAVDPQVAEIAVVTVKSLEDRPIEDFANTLFREWGIGNKETNNGVLFLIAPNEREMRIEVGYGMEGTLTDVQTFRIQEDVVKPYFKSGDYDSGIMKGTDAILSVIGGTELPPSPSRTNSFIGEYFFQFLFLMLFVIRIVYEMLASTKSWWLGGVLGSIMGLAIAYFLSSFLFGAVAVLGCALVGLVFDYLVSKIGITRGVGGGFWGGGYGGGGGSSGGFGGFGGGSSGGGGSSSSW